MKKIQLIVMALFGLIYNSVVFCEEDVVVQLTPIIRVSPELPKGMNKRNVEQGYVKIEFEVNEKGEVENPLVIESKPEKLYDRVSLEAILKSKYNPQTVNGVPQRVTVFQTFEFDGVNDRKFDAGVVLNNYEPDQITFSLNRFKENHDYKSTLIITDNTSGQIIKKQALPDSEHDWGFMARDQISPYLFFYHSVSRKNAKIKVYSRSTLELIHDIDIEPLSQAKEGSGYKVLFTLLNTNQLLTVIGKKKPKLVLIDGETGEITEKNEFEKNTLVDISDDRKYIWARKVSTVAGKTINTTLKIIETHDFRVIKKIPITNKIESIYYLDGILELTFQNDSTDESFQKMYLRLSDLAYIGNFKTSNKPGHAIDIGSLKSRIVFGQSEDGKYLNVAKLEKSEFTNITSNEIKVKYNLVQVKRAGDSSSLLIFGNKKFINLTVFDPAQRVEVEVPFNVAAGYSNSDGSKIYLTEKNGSSLALVDLLEGKMVATEKSKIAGLRFGQDILFLKTLSVNVPPGYDKVSAEDGFQNSDNIMMLNNKSDRIFVLRIKSSHLTSFAADDLSDARAVDTGRQSFQLARRNGDPDAPIMAIGIKQITFINPHDGSVISQFHYDAPVEITNYHELIYFNDKVQKTVALDVLMKANE